MNDVEGQDSFDKIYKHFPVAILDESFKIIHTSHRMGQLAEPESLDIISKTLKELIFESDCTFQYVLPYLKSGVLWSGRLTISTPNGLRRVCAKIVPIDDGHEVVNNYLFVITSLAPDEVQDVDRDVTLAMDKMAFSVSHRVRKPICSLLGLLELIKINSTPQLENGILVGHLMECVQELDKSSRDLSDLIYRTQLNSLC